MTEKGKRHTFKRQDVVDKIIDMRINLGATRMTVYDMLTDQNGEFAYSQSYAYELIADARKETDARSVQCFGEDIKEDIERFERLYEMAMAKKDNKNARANLIEISKLKGHYVERHEVSHKVYPVKLPGLNDEKKD